MTAPFPLSLKEQAIWVTALGLSLALAAAAAIPSLQALGTAAVLVSVLLAVSRLELPALVTVFLVSVNLVHLLKRVIFLIGPQPQSVYVGIQLFPTLILAAVCACAFRRRRSLPLPLSAKLLIVFLAVSLGVTLPAAQNGPPDAMLAAIHQQLLPFLLFFVGLSLTLDQFASAGRTIAILAVVSSVYGIVQLMTGPTLVDRQWAYETYSYSIHGGKVLNYLEGVSREFRAYSYYADPLTWGLYLVAGFTGSTVAWKLSRLSRRSWLLASALITAGLFASMTRTCWAAYVGTLGVYLLLKIRRLWKPWALFTAAMGLFAVAVVGGTFLYREVFLARRLPIVANPIVARYITVGTMEARISAWDGLIEAAVRKPFGYGVTPYVRKRSEAPESERPLFSHNFLVELVLNAGIPGAALFLLFYLQWLREGIGALWKTTGANGQKALLWILAFSVGSLFSGYFNGLNFMTYEFFLILGAMSGYANGLKRRPRGFCRVDPAPLPGTPPRWVAAPAGGGR